MELPKKPSTCLNLLLMAGPAMVLVALGFALRGRGGAVINSTGLTAIFVQEACGIQLDGSDPSAMVCVDVTYQGPRPLWWGHRRMRIVNLSWETVGGKWHDTNERPLWRPAKTTFVRDHYRLCYSGQVRGWSIDQQLEKLRGVVHIDGIGSEGITAEARQKP